MRKQEHRQKQLIALALALLLLGSTAMASPETSAKSNKTHRVHKHTRRPAHPAVRRGAASLPASQASHATVSPGAAAGPLRFTPQQWQDYGEMMRRESSSGDLAKQGDANLQLGNWTLAAEQYQDALNLWPDNPDGLYGMGQCAAAIGDLPRAIRYYHTAVYVPSPNALSTYDTVPGDRLQTNDVKRLMEFALLLNRAGQTQETVFIYNRAADLMDYERGDAQHGAPNVKVLLPGLSLEPTSSNLMQYTPPHLQALADTALAYGETSFGSNKEAIAHMKEAVKLFPDSPVIHYYLGDVLLRANDPGAKAAYQKAIELGDAQAAAAAKERLTQLP